MGQVEKSVARACSPVAVRATLERATYLRASCVHHACIVRTMSRNLQ